MSLSDQLWNAALGVKPDPLKFDGKTIHPEAHALIEVGDGRVTATIEWRYDVWEARSETLEVRTPPEPPKVYWRVQEGAKLPIECVKPKEARQ